MFIYPSSIVNRIVHLSVIHSLVHFKAIIPFGAGEMVILSWVIITLEPMTAQCMHSHVPFCHPNYAELKLQMSPNQITVITQLTKQQFHGIIIAQQLRCVFLWISVRRLCAHYNDKFFGCWLLIHRYNWARKFWRIFLKFWKTTTMTTVTLSL